MLRAEGHWWQLWEMVPLAAPRSSSKEAPTRQVWAEEQPCSTQLLLCHCMQDAGGAECWLETTSCSRLTNYKVSLRADELLGFLCL